MNYHHPIYNDMIFYRHNISLFSVDSYSRIELPRYDCYENWWQYIKESILQHDLRIENQRLISH